MKNRLQLLILFFSITISLFAQLEKKPLKVGDEYIVNISSNSNYRNVTSNGIVFQKEFESKGSAYIKLHFKNFDLKPNDFVRVYSPNTNEEQIYSEKGKIVGIDKHMISEFWSSVIWSDKVIVELHSTSFNNTHYGFDLDIVAYGYTMKKIDEAMRNSNSFRSLCGADNTENIACYDGTEMGRKAEAVCRLLIGGSGLCTGWLLGCDGNVMTNNHCIGSTAEANNTDFLFNHKFDDCAGTTPSTSTTVASSSTLIQTNGTLDFALVLLPVNPTATYGYLSLSSNAVTVGERIYLPQHPSGVRKRIAVNTDTQPDPNGFAMVTDAGPGRVEYFCDTQGGSSGSPVIRFADNLVIAIHNTGGCPNGSSGRSDNLISSIGANMPNCGVDDTNPEGPIISVLGTPTNSYEATDCSYQDFDITLKIAQAASANADLTFSEFLNSTATQGLDYDILTPTVTFPAGDDTDRVLTLRIYNDAFVEIDEVISLGLNLNANSGDAQLSTNSAISHTILDDDYNPDSYQVNIVAEDFENTTIPSGWTTNIVSGNFDWAFGSGFMSGGSDFPTNAAIFDDDFVGDTELDNTVELLAPVVDITLFSQTTLTFDYSLQVYNGAGTFTVEVYDGTTWQQILFVDVDTIPTTFGPLNLASYVNPNFQVRFTYDDENDFAWSAGVDNFLLRGLNNANVQTEVNTATSNASLSLLSSGVINAYDTGNSNVITTIENNDNFNYGCVDVSVSRAGTSGQSYNGSIAPSLAMDKTFNIVPTNLNAAGDTKLTFYFTETEISGWETSTGNAYSRNELYIIRENGTDVEYFPATIGDFGSEVTLSADFTGLNGTFLFGPQILLSVNEFELSSFSIYPNPVYNNLTIKTKNNVLPKSYEIYNLLGQKIMDKKVNSENDLLINTSSLTSGLYFIDIYTENGNKVFKFIRK